MRTFCTIGLSTEVRALLGTVAASLEVTVILTSWMGYHRICRIGMGQGGGFRGQVRSHSRKSIQEKPARSQVRKEKKNPRGCG